VGPSYFSAGLPYPCLTQGVATCVCGSMWLLAKRDLVALHTLSEKTQSCAYSLLGCSGLVPVSSLFDIASDNRDI
jgi:hypothetical protein